MNKLSRQLPLRRPDTRWLLTFADLISLLLTFFVMMFAMSSVKQVTWDLMTNALSQRLNPDRGWEKSVRLVDRTIDSVASAEASDLDYLYAVITEKTRANPVLAQAILRRLDGELVITLPSDLLFAPGRADLVDEAGIALGLLGETLRHIGNRIDVHGHADPRPVTNSAFVSNWELSLGRALAVADALRKAGYEREVVTLGLADGRFGDIDRSLPLTERLRLARRVDVVIRESYAREGGGAT